MCGIAGFWKLSGFADDTLCAVADGMVSALVHRGPDYGGTWADTDAGLALGHRRLAILDLSPAGHQPMVSDSGRYAIVFNGEIYNHLEMRRQLVAEGVGPRVWRGHSDTETLITAIEHWGLEVTLRRSVGMFAVAVWDRRERTLQLARDRFGEKPLYYGWVGRGPDRAFAFASELKALRSYPGFEGEVCREALVQFLRFNYVPAPRSIFRGIFKLEPGCLLTASWRPPAEYSKQPLRPGQSHGTIQITNWYSFETVAREGNRHLLTDEAEALDLLEKRLVESIRLQSLADVPLGAFLSGGIDSSTIVALMQQQARLAGMPPVKTFTIGFDQAGFDEAPFAAAVARHLGTDHRELRVTVADARELIPGLPRIYDEPFADSSQIPSHLVCREARPHVTVAMTGDAGDELFGGYNRYFWGPRVWNKVAWLPFQARRALGAMVSALPVATWNALGRAMSADRLGDKAHKLASRLSQVRDIDDLYRSLVSEWPDPAMLVKGLDTGAAKATSGQPGDWLFPVASAACGPEARMMFQDTLTYLPDDILCKVDRAAMAASLETRVPFLDHRVVELAWRLPTHMKIREDQGKWALRQILYRHVPRQLIERPKAGFAIPVGQWLRGPLREWAEHLLTRDRLEQGGYLHAEPIRRVWSEHLSGRREWTARLWGVLMFQAWVADNAESLS